MRYTRFRRLVSYIADPKAFMETQTDPEKEREELLEFQRANVEFMKKTQKKNSTEKHKANN